MAYRVNSAYQKPRLIESGTPSLSLRTRQRIVVTPLHQIANAFVTMLIWAYMVTGVSNVIADPQPYYEPGINPYRELSSQQGEVDTVDPFLGQLKIRHLDLLLPGNGGLDIKVWRYYDTANIGGPVTPAGEGLGVGWVSHFGRLRNSCEQYGVYAIRPILELPDGSVQKFFVAQSGTGYGFISKDGWAGNCIGTAYSGLGMILISPEGTRYELSVKSADVWLVKKITDRNGNWINFDYGLPSLGQNPTMHLLQLTTNDGRSIGFQYDGGNQYGLKKLKMMTSNGQVWAYEYVAFDGQPERQSMSYSLKKITRPDGAAWIYDYPDLPGYSVLLPLRGYLGTMTNPFGAITHYEYGYLFSDGGLSTVKVTKKTVNNPYGSLTAFAEGDKWHYRYKLRELIDGAYLSVTNITDPLGNVTTYRHASSTVQGQAWRFGLLTDKLMCGQVAGSVDTVTCAPGAAIYREQNDWSGQVISSNDQYVINNGIESLLDYQIFRPLLIKRTITRDGTAYVTQYLSHDAYGNPARIVETGNGTTRTTDLTYFNDPAKWITGLLDREMIDGSWIVDRTFDANGNVKSISKYGVPTDFSYYSTGDLASLTDAKGSRIDYSDYFRGVPRREDQQGGVTVYRTVNPTGTVATETNGEGYRTAYSYDGLNRLSGVTPPVGNPTVIQWGSGLNGIEKRVIRGSYQEVVKHDGFGRVIDSAKRDVATSALVRRAYRYDALGRKLFETYPTTSTAAILSATTLPSIQFTYDPLGRLIKLTHADGKTRQLQYLVGNQIKITNENGKATTYSYRSYGDPDEHQLMGVTAPVAAANMVLTRNPLGQITTQAQAGVTRSMQYDSRGYLVKTYHPEIGWVTYGRDAVGNPTSKSVGAAPSVRTINYTHDSRNRLTAVAYQDAATPAVALSYNRVDDVVSASRGTVMRAYNYDANRNLVGESLTVDGKSFSLGYFYDGNDAATQVTYPDGQTVNYYPDALGRPTAVSPYVTSVVYHPSGQVAGMTYANGVTATQAFNARLWPSQMSVVKSATGLLNTTYSYDGLGNVTSISDSVDTSLNRSLGYDDIDRLTSVTGPWGAGSISYDGRGNLLSQNYGAPYSRTYTYDTANRLASYTGSSAFTYDAWGNATRSGNALSYHLFDDASNLHCASCDTASPLLFEYDANNYRVKKTRNGVVTYSLYAKDGNLMMEYTPSAGDLKQFAYHNKKQVSMRHVVDPAMTLGQNGMFGTTRFAGAIPYKSTTHETDLLARLLSPPPLLTTVQLANAN